MNEKLNHDKLTRTLNGFEEVGITKAFGDPITELRGTMVPRALLFVHLRRRGANHNEAFKSAMEVELEVLQEMFEDDVPEGNG